MYRINGKGNWYIHVGGRARSSKTRDKEKARILEGKLNTEAWDRQNGLAVPTWEQMCLAWMEAEPISASKHDNALFMEWWEPHLNGRRVTDITPALIRRIITEHRPGVSLTERKPENSTANRYVAFVKRVIRSQSNFNPKLITYPAALGRDRWLSAAEWTTLKSVMDEDTQDILEFALATGLREANCMFFEWGWQHGNSIIVPASSTKTEKPYGLPLNRTALEVLKRRAQKPVKHVRYAFTHRGGVWYRVKLLRALKTACKKAQVPEILVHGLRHTFTTWLAQNGVPKEIRMRLTCHSAKDVHDRYTHFDVESLRPHVEVVDRVIKSLEASQEVPQVSVAAA
jgi:integrase